VADTRADLHCGHHLALLCLVSKLPHMGGGNVDGLACCLHWPMNCGKHARAQSLLTGVVPSRHIAKAGVALSYLSQGCGALKG
jgi:hypothetical protein